MRVDSFFELVQPVDALPPFLQWMRDDSLAEYIGLSLSTQDFRAYFGMLSALVDNIDSTGELEVIYSKVVAQLVKEIKQLEECRATNWTAGHDLESIDRLLENQLNNKGLDEAVGNLSFEKYSSSENLPKPWWDVLYHTISQRWVTKTDRITSWLLHNLATLPEEANHH